MSLKPTLREVNADDPISAAEWNNLVRAIRSGMVTHVEPPLEMLYYGDQRTIRLSADDRSGEGKLSATLARGTRDTPESATMLLYTQNADASWTLSTIEVTVYDIGYLPHSSLNNGTNIHWERIGSFYYYAGGGC